MNVFGDAKERSLAVGRQDALDGQLAVRRHFEAGDLGRVQVVEAPGDGGSRVSLGRTPHGHLLADGDGLVARNFQEDRLLVQDVQINNLKKE